MAGKVTLEIRTGARKGERFVYEGTERVVIGRQDDCGIVMPEKTVSRYHCQLDIDPPEVRLRDFGSLNGTFINGERIGGRGKDKTIEEAREDQQEDFPLKDGDTIRLGMSCEILCRTQGEALKKPPLGIVREKKAPEAPKMSPGRRKCARCGKEFVPEFAENTLCQDCSDDWAKVLDGILEAIQDGKPKSLEPGAVEGYEKVAMLGKGGMGEVWKVREKKTGKIFALKTMLPQVAAEEKGKQMFLREAKISESLVHRNVVRTYDSGCSNDVFYILMDLCNGGSVDALLKKRGGRLPLELATWIILQALSGLDYVHNAEVETLIRTKSGYVKERTTGVVHRDFKPGNIFLSDSSTHPVAMVADFGMAKAFETAGFTNITAPGNVRGTLVFMPRQQVLDSKYAKPEIDVWAAAATYYCMLTGYFPKDIKQGKNELYQVITQTAVPIRQRDPRIPEGIARVIDAALVEQPEIGCKSAAELRAELVRALPVEVRQYCREIL